MIINLDRFANSDFALAMAVRQRQPGESFKFTLRLETADVSDVSTYDIACEYVIHLSKRFEKNFFDVAGAVAKMEWAFLLSMLEATRIIVLIFLGRPTWSVSVTSMVRQQSIIGPRRISWVLLYGK